jgi:hypothetical protein
MFPVAFKTGLVATDRFIFLHGSEHKIALDLVGSQGDVRGDTA